MIDLEAVLQWMNEFEPMRLSQAVRAKVEAMNAPEVTKSRMAVLMNDALNTARASADRLEYAEALVYTAVKRYQHNYRLTASQNLQEALTIFPQNSYKFGVTAYMLGWVLWDMEERENAQSYWQQARGIFDKKRAFLQQRQDGMQADIGTAGVDDMAEVYNDWLHKWGEKYLREQSAQLVEILERKRRRRDVTAYDTIDRLLDSVFRTKEYQAEAEACVVSGYTCFVLENYPLAEAYFTRAVATYLPGTHPQAVALWMLGMVQWRIEGEFGRAAQSWERALTTFEDLAVVEKNQNRHNRFEWYSEKLALMRSALTLKLQTAL